MGTDRKTRRLWIPAIVIVILAFVGWLAWYELFREEPQQLANNSMEEAFKYGSIGAENQNGLPFWIWMVLPRMFPEYLPAPGGYAALGFAWEPGREMPVGFTRKTIGFERVAINCALCHTAMVRKPGEVVPRLYLGGPGHTMDILAYQRFLFACASDPRFTAGNILAAVGQIYQLPWLDRQLYRFLLVPQTRKTLLKQKKEFAWTNSRPIWGRGRIDPLNPVKVMLGHGVGNTIGNSDMEPTWNMGPRVQGKMAFHWDGLNTDFTEVVRNSALGDGASRRSMPLQSLDRLEKWLLDLPPAKFESLFPVDRALAAAGEPIFRQRCADCHAFGGGKTGQVLPLTDEAWGAQQFAAAPRPLFTDPHRAEEWGPADAQALNDYTKGYPWAFTHFRSTSGYVNVPLDAIWIRAPYLHNGSVPYLAEMFEVPAKRTKVFYQGDDVYDPVRMGFVAEGPEAERMGTRLDTAQPGNSNQGHLWGTDLSDGEKKALLEYLKTL
ncbi:MAG TPA: cytochrome c [Thermoanaerobaculia bacterium]|nr:cytochrome c [Thermoanaerobaculia bacterium]